MKMHQQTRLFIFFIAFSLFSLCFGSYLEDPFPVSQYHDQIYSDYPTPASLYTSRNTDFHSSMMTKKRPDRGSSFSGSTKVVNVDDFGAKGNGQDDTKVETSLNIYSNKIYLHFQNQVSSSTSCIILTTYLANLRELSSPKQATIYELISVCFDECMF